MFKDFKSNRFGGKPGGGKKFGDRGGSSWKDRGPRGPGAYGKPEMHKATCATCGADCMVPFKPNGTRPVLCSNCFKRDDNGPSKREHGSHFDGPRRSERSEHSFGGNGGGSNVNEELASINRKLDTIVRLLNELE